MLSYKLTSSHDIPHNSSQTPRPLPKQFSHGLLRPNTIPFSTIFPKPFSRKLPHTLSRDAPHETPQIACHKFQRSHTVPVTYLKELVRKLQRPHVTVPPRFSRGSFLSRDTKLRRPPRTIPNNSPTKTLPTTHPSRLPANSGSLAPPKPFTHKLQRPRITPRNIPVTHP